MNIVIIGNGIAGITFATEYRKKNPFAHITIVSDEHPYFFSRTALMYVFMGHMRFEHTQPYETSFWQVNNFNLIQDTAVAIDDVAQEIELATGLRLKYDHLILATGAVPNKIKLANEDLEGVQGLYHKQDLQTLEHNAKNCKTAVIVGGGLIGIELAEMLHFRGIQVEMLVYDSHYWGNVLPIEEAELIDLHLKKHHINVHYNTTLKAIHGSKWVDAITTTTEQTIHCQLLGLTIGVSPNIAWLQNSKIDSQRGFLVNEYFETNLKNVYAIGDCAQFKQQTHGGLPVEQLWYTGKMHGEFLAQHLLGNSQAYNRGIWFNSAKFFDIEYQTYGRVPAKPSPSQLTFFWSNLEKDKCFRININAETGSIEGMNFFGIRFRQHFAHECIANHKSLEYFFNNFEKGLFDPEFSTNFTQEIKRNITTQYHGSLLKS